MVAFSGPSSDGGFEARPAFQNIQVNPGGLSDSPTDRDTVGFTPYVRALAWFLMSEKTLPPLTISIEAPWGAGKSSFMLQLENAIRAVAADQLKSWENLGGQARKPDDIFCIRFNAWRNDKDEALWAAFAITFLRQLTRGIPLWRRVWANLRLQWSRIDRGAAQWQLVQLALFAIATAGLAIIYFRNPDLTKLKDSAPIAGILGVAWLGTVWTAFKKVKDVFGNPLSADLSKLVTNPHYEDKLAFIDRFQSDFSKIVRCYAGEKGRIFIFIDDLDRCDVPRAADLMQAINLLLSTDQANLYFILGIDREMVAAGLAAKHEKILPYLAANRTNADASLIARVGVDYGYSFLEKFVQVPFRVPVIQNIDKLVSNLVGPSTITSADDPAPEKAAESAAFEIVAGADPAGFDVIIADMGQIFEFNPRRLKQFVNVLRLRVMIALSTNILLLPGQPLEASKITLEQLGMFTALLLRWPQLIGELLAAPNFLTLPKPSPLGNPAPDFPPRWRNEPGFKSAVGKGYPYSLDGVDLRPLLLVMPDTYGRGLGTGSQTGGRSGTANDDVDERVYPGSYSPTTPTSKSFAEERPSSDPAPKKKSKAARRKTARQPPLMNA